MKDLWYQTEGTCSRFIHVELSDDDVKVELSVEDS